MNVTRLYNIDDYYMEWLVKKYDGSEEALHATVSILDWTHGGNFHNILDIKKTYYNRPFVRVFDDKYILVKNIKGKKPRLSDEGEVISIIKCLAKFHLSSEGYVLSSGIKVQANWGRTMEKFKGFACCLERYFDATENKKFKNEFEEKTHDYIEVLYKNSRDAIKFFRSEKYINAIEKSMKRREICVNDATSGIIMIGKNNEPYINKVFSLGYNMCEEDVASVVRRHIELTGNIGIINKAISEYMKIRSLDDVGIENIKRMALFPEGPIKIISKYMKKGLYKEDMLQGFLSSAKIYEKLNMEV
ncbi:hypothetical protein [Clostridium sp.]|uniref:hypothetical protein n=1 Tax=Clostridium sp. TaxID=1506 RepID=UPI002FC75515